MFMLSSARCRTPQFDKDIPWPTYKDAGRYMEFGPEGNAPSSNLKQDQCQFWNNVLQRP